MAKKDDDWDLNDLEDEDTDASDDEDEDDDDDTADEEDSARSKRLILTTLKIAVSLTLLGAAGVMIFAPEKIPTPVTDKLNQVKPLVNQAKQQVENVVSKITKDEPAPPKPADLPQIRQPAAQPRPTGPANFAQKRTLPAQQPAETTPAARQPQQNRFNLRGAGKIPDLLTAVSQNPSLRDALLKADVYTFESLPRLRPFIRSFILQWANAKTPAEVEALAGMPFSAFENQVLVDLLPFTTLRRAGLTPSFDGNLIKESPEEASGSLFMYLKPIVDTKETADEKLEVVEPVSTFLLYRCGQRQECLESWDLLIDMLELSEFKERLRQ